MNTSITIGLYDFLNMVVMGFLILLPVVNFPTDAVFLVWFIPCFIVGLIYHKLMENILGVCLRNKDGMISQAYKSVNNQENKEYSSKENYYKAYYFLMEKRQLGYIPILEAQAAFLRNLLPIPLYYIFMDFVSDVKQEREMPFIILGILIVFGCFFFFKKPIKMSINLRTIYLSLFFLFLLLTITFALMYLLSKVDICHNVLMIALLVIVFFIIPFLWYKTQMKIHELVWEGKKYLEQVYINYSFVQLSWFGREKSILNKKSKKSKKNKKE